MATTYYRKPLLPLALLATLAAAVPVVAATSRVADLPRCVDRPQTTDWLIDDSPYTAGVYRTERADEIVIDNGLLRRTFRLAPNAATVGFDNLANGQSLLRAVKPEAIVTIDGIRYAVGGLKGQPDHAYLLPEWIDQMTADPAALHFTGFETGRPRPRFAWKQVRHHAADAKWPPPGVALRMDYAMPQVTPERLAQAALPSDCGRRNLFTTDFEPLDSVWKTHTSTAHSRSSFENEGKPGEIYTPANTAVFTERPLPAGTRLVEATIDVGTDRSGSWGPGIALIWEDRTIKFNLRPGGDAQHTTAQFGLWDGRRENSAVSGPLQVDVSKPWTLRLRVTDKAVYCDAMPQAGLWKTCASVPLTKPLSDPLAVRVGKMDVRGGGSDHAQPGSLVRLHVLHAAAYGKLQQEGLAEIRRKLAAIQKLRVSVHYELYDGVPVLSKWITIDNPTDQSVTVDSFTSELLAAVEYSSAVEDRGTPKPAPNIHVETDYAFGSFVPDQANRYAVHWQPDPEYLTQVNYRRQTPCLLEVRPTVGPDQDIAPGGTFESFRAFLLPYDATDRERKSLALRRMYRVIAPWVTENPLMMHVRWSDPKTVHRAIDQCAAVGFEMIILTFGSGFNIENDSPAYLAKMRGYADAARKQGIEIGGYSLLASRRVGGGNDVVSPPGDRPTFGNCPALTSKWGQDYFRKLYQFYDQTGFRLLEHDGSYPGDLDVTVRPPLQKGLRNSRWAQWKVITDFYKYCRGKGVYLNVPDYYYLSGSTKCGMGYRETNWSLPRAQQVIHTRQNIYDGTWTKTPSMGWMFVPLTQYHGGGSAATIEPLNDHLDHYRRMLQSNLAFGVQACYRGPRLYDTDRTRELVAHWVAWFKKYRDILESDVIHGRRADGRQLDWMLHVNPKLEHRGLLVAFNPRNKPVKETLEVNLYYTGLTKTARIRTGEGPWQTYQLDRKFRVSIPVQVGAEEMTYLVIAAPHG